MMSDGWILVAWEHGQTDTSTGIAVLKSCYLCLLLLLVLVPLLQLWMLALSFSTACAMSLASP